MEPSVDAVNDHYPGKMKKTLYLKGIYYLAAILVSVFFGPAIWEWMKEGKALVSNGENLRDLGLILVAFIGLPLAFYRIVSVASSLKNERYQRGIEMLGSDTVAVQIGGLQVLEELAKEQPDKYHIPAMTTLCAFLRHGTQETPDENSGFHSVYEMVCAVIRRRSRKQIHVEKAQKWKLDLKCTKLRGANLLKAFLSRSDLRGSNLCKANLREAHLHGANLSEADLREANLRKAHLGDANLSGADLCEANLREVNLHEANLSRTDLSKANLRGACLSEANLSEADLHEANLSPSTLPAELHNADLRRANLSNANLSAVILGKADLRGANLSKANLSGANLSLADLRGADLREADLFSAILSGAKMNGAVLCKADLFGADLRATDLSEADLNAANLSAVDLDKVEGLTEAQILKAEWDRSLTPPRLPEYLSHADVHRMREPLPSS